MRLPDRGTTRGYCDEIRARKHQGFLPCQPGWVRRAYESSYENVGDIMSATSRQSMSLLETGATSTTYTWNRMEGRKECQDAERRDNFSTTEIFNPGPRQPIPPLHPRLYSF